MNIISLETMYNQGGSMQPGKEYIFKKEENNYIFSINSIICPADIFTADAFRKEITLLNIDNMADDYNRGGPAFLKWQLTYNDKVITGTNTTPPQVSKLIDLFHFFTEDFPTEADIIHEAVIFATKAHSGQVRKGTDIPYITHPLEVCNILTEMKAGTALKIAGLLHDVAEDTPVTLQEIEDKFGKEVVRLVNSHTEDKTKSWTERKQSAIDRVKTGDVQVAMLIMADKISNLQSMLSDYLVVGEDLWNRFGSTKAQQSKHNHRLIEALSYLTANENTIAMYNKMVALNEELYVDFYIDIASNSIYYDKYAMDKAVFHRSDKKWQTVENIPETAVKVTRTKAKKLMGLWSKLDETA